MKVLYTKISHNPTNCTTLPNLTFCIFKYISVVSFIKSEPDVMSYWLWLGAALGTGFGLFSSAIASVAAILKSASGDKKGGTMILLFISNFASGIG